jgi:hypothetical protein
MSINNSTEYDPSPALLQERDFLCLHFDCVCLCLPLFVFVYLICPIWGVYKDVFALFGDTKEHISFIWGVCKRVFHLFGACKRAYSV